MPSFDVMPGFGDEGTFTPDNLFAGDFPRVADEVVIASGQNLTRGAVLGRVTATGKYILSLSAAGDGSQTPVAILAQDTDASGGDKSAPVYLSGEFNTRALTIGTGHTAAAIKFGLQARSIYLRGSVAA